MNWWQWRVIGDPRISDGLFEVRQRWRFVDLYEASLYLDAMDAVQETFPKK